MFLRRDETTIATLLKQAGYDTCHVGKWHLNGHFNSPEQTQPNDHGFAHWFSTHNNAAPSHENPTNFVRDGQPVGPQTGFSCQLIVDEAIRWLQARPDAARPFFLHVCFHEPHEPIASPADLVGQYPQAKGKGEALYYANVSNMDRAVGRLLAMLKGLKLEENTLVCFTSDNGPEGLNRYPNAWRSWGTAGPLRGRKLYVYEGGVRVPGIVRWPGKIAPRQVRDEPVGSVDLLPTVCELAKIAPPTGQPLDGTSLVPLLLGKTWERRQPLFWHYLGGVDNRQAALRDGDWKIVGAWDQNPKMPAGATLRPGDVPMMKQSRLVGFELYNVARDPAEKEDLSTAEPRRLAELSQALQSRYAEILAQGPYWFEDQPANRNLTK
jgi:arylsulfatase A